MGDFAKATEFLEKVYQIFENEMEKSNCLHDFFNVGEELSEIYLQTGMMEKSNNLKERIIAISENPINKSDLFEDLDLKKVTSMQINN